jgi:signal transduction histidine kinase
MPKRKGVEEKSPKIPSSSSPKRPTLNRPRNNRLSPLPPKGKKGNGHGPKNKGEALQVSSRSSRSRINALQKTEAPLHLQHAFLQEFVKKNSRGEYLDAVVNHLQRWIGCCCSGIRVLDEYGNIPYEAYVGFSREFWESESHLSLKRDQCACIRVIAGTPEHQDALVMTPAGSFHCENTVQFVAGLSEGEKEGYRGTCVRSGYLTVVIIPIRYRDEVLGALHLADTREKRIPRPTVEAVESLMPLVGEAIHRFNLEEELQRSYATQQAVNALLSLSLEDLSLEQFLPRALQQIVSIPFLTLESKGGIFLAGEEAKTFVLKAQIGLPPQIRKSCAQIPWGHCSCGQAAAGGEILFIDHRQGDFREFCEILGPHGHYCVPLISGTGTLGVLHLLLPPGYADNERKRELLRILGKILASILERKKGEETIRRSERQLHHLSHQLLTAQERERKRIAQELHDGLGQNLATIKFGMERSLQGINREIHPAAFKTLETTIQVAQTAADEVHRLASDLRPAILDDLGILATISWFCREFETIYSTIQLKKSLEIQEADIPESLKIVLYRVLQEALNNIAKHSHAQSAKISLRQKNGQIELIVEDKGKGFSLESSRTGLGLASMRERVEVSGGSFILQTSREQGTKIRATWPSA